MKRILLAAGIAALIAGCEYVVALVSEPQIDIDKAAIGLWQRPAEGGAMERLLMLPLNAREYLVSYPAGTEDAMFGRACLCRVAERTMVQIEWFGTARGDLPNDQRVYQYGVYSVDGETLTFQLLNSDVVSKDIKSAEELAKAIEANRENPNLFKEKMVFRKSAD